MSCSVLSCFSTKSPAQGCCHTAHIRFCITQKEHNSKIVKRNNEFVCGFNVLGCQNLNTLLVTVQQKHVIISQTPKKPTDRRLQSNESIYSLVTVYLTSAGNNLCNTRCNPSVCKCTIKWARKIQETTTYISKLSHNWQPIWCNLWYKGKGNDQCTWQSEFWTLQLDSIRWGSGSTGNSPLNAKLISSSTGPKYSTGCYGQQLLHGCVSVTAKRW